MVSTVCNMYLSFRQVQSSATVVTYVKKKKKRMYGCAGMMNAKLVTGAHDIRQRMYADYSNLKR